jgi:hypothetical protein
MFFRSFRLGVAANSTTLIINYAIVGPKVQNVRIQHGRVTWKSWAKKESFSSWLYQSWVSIKQSFRTDYGNISYKPINWVADSKRSAKQRTIRCLSHVSPLIDIHNEDTLLMYTSPTHNLRKYFCLTHVLRSLSVRSQYSKRCKTLRESTSFPPLFLDIPPPSSRRWSFHWQKERCMRKYQMLGELFQKTRAFSWNWEDLILLMFLATFKLPVPIWNLNTLDHTKTKLSCIITRLCNGSIKL